MRHRPTVPQDNDFGFRTAFDGVDQHGEIRLGFEYVEFRRDASIIRPSASRHEVARQAAPPVCKKIAFLRKAWQEGIDSGEAEELDFQVLKAEGHAKLAAAKSE